MTQQDFNQALSKAKIQLMAKPDTAFYTTVLFSLVFKWDDECRTAYTNGTVLGINQKWFMTLSPEERVFLLVHEAMHVAYMHMIRLMEREHARWNEAADHVINLQLLDRGFKMPANGLADRQYAGMSTEEVYKLLPSRPKNGYDLDIQAPEGPSDELQRDVEDILIRAAIQSKMANDKPGTIPGEIEIFLNNLLSPKLPWNVILQKYMHSMAKNDYSFRKPNRRFFPQHILPSLYSKKLMDIAVAVDTSGSVSDEEFKAFVSEVHSILKMMKPDKLTLVQFDTDIKSVTEIRSTMDLMQSSFTGRGGTDINPVLSWANEKKPQLLLIFSDGGFRFTGHTTKANIVWLIHSNPQFTAPMGKVIHYKAI